MRTKYLAAPLAGVFTILFLALIAFCQPAVSKAAEMPRGTAAKIDLKPGDSVQLN
ncbi:MAG: hypothetical protein GY948_00775 [Alphaproteobacteria bacterium]|nr:hypothetical protein [Alphaproteobacteria bacterium]